MARPRRPHGLFAVLALLLLLGSRWVYAGTPLRTVVRIVSSDDKTLIARLRGQLADLDLTLIEVADPAIESRLTGQLSTADRYASTHHARVVVWFSQKGDVLRVYVLIPATDRLLVRAVPAPTEERSAAFEQAAFVVRAALQAIAANLPVGVPREEVLRDEGEAPAPSLPVAQAPAPKPTATPKTTPPPPPPPHRTTLREEAGVGWGVGYNGQFVAQGPVVRVGLEARRWQIGLGLRYGLPATSENEFGAARRTEHALSVTGGIPFRLSSELSWCACAEIGVAAFQRDTVATSSGTAPASGRWLVSPLAGLRARMTYRRALTPGIAFGLGFEVGADVFFAPPRFQFISRTDAQAVSSDKVWPVEPRGALVLELATH